MGKILYFDCQSGISGDMTVAALLDLGIDREEFTGRLASLNLPGYRIEIERKPSYGLDALDFNVILTSHEHTHRNLRIIEEIIDAGSLDEQTRDLSKRIFRRVAQAESVVHGIPLDQVHFHEVGAIDSIVDIVAASVCITMLDVDTVLAAPIPLGTGFIECAHGKIPLPAPATAEILKGIPVYRTDIRGELVTPTGAAILRTLTGNFGSFPAMRISSVGYGRGKKDYGMPNLLRVFLGEKEITDTQKEELLILETNIDDMSGELYSHIIPLLIDRGAKDAYMTGIIMKKGRPGVLLTVLCLPEDRSSLEEIIFRETTTLGIRCTTASRRRLRRESVILDTRFGPLGAKASYMGGELLKVSPEYEECLKAAKKHGVSLREVYTEIEGKKPSQE